MAPMEKGFSWSNIAVGQYQLVDITSRQRDEVADQSGSRHFSFSWCIGATMNMVCLIVVYGAWRTMLIFISALIMIVRKSVILLVCSS